MKMRLGKTLIETDNIETIVITAEDTVLITFVSGQEVEVICHRLIIQDYLAVSKRNADELLNFIITQENGWHEN